MDLESRENVKNIFESPRLTPLTFLVSLENLNAVFQFCSRFE